MRPWRERWIKNHPPDIGAKSWDAIFAGGKEIRPSLFCELWCHLIPDQPPDGELAFAIECIHAASLILDDTPLMDNAAERRGRPTIHRLYTTYKAIYFAGEILEIVFDIWTKKAPKDTAEAAAWWNFLRDKALQLCIGQYYDLLGGTDLHTLAVLKTGTLFEFATELVALRAGLSRPAWRTWGRQIGVLFQWADDWADREEDAAAGNRNAFLEAPDLIKAHYCALLEKSNIGTEWRARPFGNWLMRYYEAVPERAGWNGSAVGSSAAIPPVIVTDQPHAEFMASCNPATVVSALAKRFTLYYVPSSRASALYKKYFPQIPNFVKRLTEAGMERVVATALAYRDNIVGKARRLWQFDTEDDWELVAIQQIGAFMAEKGAGQDLPALSQVADIVEGSMSTT